MARLLPPESASVEAVAREIGVGAQTLERWRSDARCRVVAIVVASIGIWLFHFMILKGVQQAAFINSIVTVAKIIPILVFIVILIFGFRLDLFQANLYGGGLAAPQEVQL